MSKSPKRARAAALLMVALAVTAAGCGGDTTTASGPSGPGEESEGPVELEFWSWIPAAEQAAKAYEASHPGVSVKVENPADASVKLRTALEAGTGAPDIAMAGYTDMPQIVGAGGLADLSEYGAADHTDEYVDWAMDLVSSGDTIYGIPQDIGPTALVYRRDILEQYGITPPTTWDEFAEAARQIDAQSGGKVAIANIPGTWSDWFLGLAWQAGSEPWSLDEQGVYTQQIDDAAAMKVATFWQGLLDEGLVTTYPAFSQDLWNALSNGEIATSIEAAWGAGGWSQNVTPETAGLWGVADLPQWDADAFASGNMGGSALIVPEQGEHKQEATDFAIWLTSSLEGTETQYTGSGTFSASETGLSLPAFEDASQNPSKFFDGQNVAAVYSKAASAVEQPFTFAPWYPAAADAYNAAFADALAGKGDLMTALGQWQEASLKAARDQGYDVQGE